MSAFDETIDDYPDYDDDTLDFEDEFDPNRCPDCGGDLVFGMCPDVACMWTEEDDWLEEDAQS